MRGHVRKKGSGWAFVLDAGHQRYRQCAACDRSRRYWLDDGDPPQACGRCGGELVEREGRRQRWSPIYPKRRGPGGAEEALAKALGRLDGGQDPVPANVALGDYLDAWLAETIRARVATGKLAATTAQGYATHVKVHLKPRLGAARLRTLRPGQVAAMMADMMGEGLSASSAVRVRATLSKALSDAEHEGLVERNAARLAEPPEVEQRVVSTFSADEVKRILEVCETHRLGAMYVLGLYTGMRSSELRGLRWSDVDLDACTYRVATTMHRIHKRHAAIVGASGLVEGKPKNKKSGAETALSRAAVEVLRAHRKAQAAERLSAPTWADPDRVFTSSTGKPLDASAAVRRWQAILADAGVAYHAPDGKGRGLHELRRSFATALRQAGVSIEEVQRLGRWSSPRILLESYSGTEDERLRGAVDRLGESFGG